MLQRLRMRGLGALASLGILVVACSGGGGEGASDSEIADAGVLTIDDFPGGWREVRDEGLSLGVVTLGMSVPDLDDCRAIGEDADPDVVAGEGSAEFTRLDASAANVVQVFESADDAQDYLDALEGDELADCLEDALTEALEDQFALPEDLLTIPPLPEDLELPDVPELDPGAIEDFLPSAEDFDVSAGRLSVGVLGDQATAYETVASMDTVFGLDVYPGGAPVLDFVAVRVGPAVTTVVVTSMDGPPDLTETLAETSSEHLDAVIG